jgi:eukaryotic-like serine/threonine-protein kinase
MALPPGTRIGSYEVLSLIGAGGMGEVYRATDTRLDRNVAIKVLPADLAADPVFRARFAREARTISSLDHPHICALHDVGESDGTAYLVMQYLEGETLAARLARGALPLDEALRRACDIASALDHAHRHQVVHRDLKPGNVMLTKGGARLLDFGLAKPLAALTDAHSTHLDVPVTSAGTVVGTVQYMAPEQIEGREADARTDIFAFGAVLHEMLTGARAFNALSQASLMSAILRDDPPAPSTLTTGIPPALDHVVKRCLAKDPEQRWASAHDLLIELEWVREGGSAGTTTTQAAAIAPHTRRTDRLAWGLVAVSLAAAVATAAWAVLGREAPVRPPSRFVVAAPPGVAWDAYNPPSLSPDGHHLAVVGIEENGARALWLRRLDDVAWRKVEGTSGFTGAGAASAVPGAPFWSPDGRLLLFAQGQHLKRVAVGGSPEVVGTIPNGRDFSAGSVNAAGVVLLGYVNGPLDRVALGGGTPVPLAPLDAARGEHGHLTPSFLPDGTSFLYSSSSKEFPAMLGSLTSSERTELIPRAYGPMYVHPGLLLFYRANVTMLQRFDLSRRRPEGDAQPLEPQLPPDTFAVSANGTLAYLTYRTGSTKVRQGEITGSNTRLAWFDRSGREVEALTPLGGYMCPRLSPDERFIAVEKFDRDHEGEVWTVDTRRGIETRLTVNPSRDSDAAWSPRGDRLTWARNFPPQVLVQAADGSSAPTTVARPGQTSGGVFTADWSRDGRYLAVLRYSSFTVAHIEFVALDGSPAVEWPSTTFSETGARFSPDGRWIAYVSEETGTPEVYVRPFPPTSERVRVSTAGGYQPDWRRDGGELYYVTPDRTLTSVAVRAADGRLEFGKPAPLFRAPIAAPSWGRNHYQPSADGQRFLVNVLKPNELKDSPELVVVLDWAQSTYNELRRAAR